jgi:hypothetical protein
MLFCQRTNKQTDNPLLSGYKNYTEACKEVIAQTNKQKAEYQALNKAKFSTEKMIKEQHQDKNVILNIILNSMKKARANRLKYPTKNSP